MKSATLIDLHSVPDAERGTLCVAEHGRDIPFEIRRIFYLYDIKKDMMRGQHAHREQEQFIICLSGSIELSTIDRNERKQFILTKPTQGIYFPAMTWVSVKVLEIPAIYLVASSGLYDENDYVRNFVEFESLLKVM